MRRKGSPRLGVTWQNSMSKALLFLTYLNKGKEVSCHSMHGSVVRVRYITAQSLFSMLLLIYFQGKYNLWQFDYCSCILEFEISLIHQILFVSIENTIVSCRVLSFDLVEMWQVLNVASRSIEDGVVSRLLLCAWKCRFYHDCVIQF